jgi:hypothetical protein
MPTNANAPRGSDPEARLEGRIERVPESGCWLWTGHLCWGYGQVMLNYRRYRAHRWTWELFNGPIPAGLQVLHRCDVRCCVNPAHLFLGTHEDNMGDMAAKSRQAHGARHGMSKLTEAQVLDIKMSQEPAAHIARRLGLDASTIQYIRKGRLWKHVA